MKSFLTILCATSYGAALGLSKQMPCYGAFAGLAVGLVLAVFRSHTRAVGMGGHIRQVICTSDRKILMCSSVHLMVIPTLLFASLIATLLGIAAFALRNGTIWDRIFDAILGIAKGGQIGVLMGASIGSIVLTFLFVLRLVSRAHFRD